ncbi:MAG TPA: hypothetical protein VGX76_07845, partial [Pirellulales bacterium]|nr:hypothetical protein [Pirellulales bacterium]
MAHSLPQRIAGLRGRARRLLVLYALGWIMFSAVAALLVVALSDYLVRFQDHGIRLMASLAVLVALAWACRRFAPSVFKRRLGDLEIAKHIERRFPVLDDRLASTIEFLKQPENDPQAGSAALRRAVILETASQAEDLDFAQIIDARPAWRAACAAGAVVLVAAGIALVAPGSARLALARLIRPFGADAWPRQYSVVFREAPTRLAAGQNFEVELLQDAQHRVPPNARIHYRYQTSPSGVEQESEAMRSVAGAMVARKENVTRPFWYRAEGGDDASMDWIYLEVVEPPRLESLQLTLHPPDYTGLGPEPSEKNIHALRGTRVGLIGTATKKLRKVTICQEGHKSLAAGLASDGYSFELSGDD